MTGYMTPGEYRRLEAVEGEDDLDGTDAGYTYCKSGSCGECDACIDEGNRRYELEIMP